MKRPRLGAKPDKPHPDPELLEPIFAQFPGVLAVYLFGSTAAGKRHAESDIDLAIEVTIDLGNHI